ncbi:hypothetical protein HY967_00380 [Candidatus Jorgensenbacteria bacterium]|nr:hypothetical protein [Candidatus Jorgensenbacteria bacterium]
MELVKELGISEFTGTRATNAPYKMVLEDLSSYRHDDDSILNLDVETIVRHSLQMSFALIGRIVVCTFTAKELPLEENGTPSLQKLTDDDLLIESLNKNEHQSPQIHWIPPSHHKEMNMILKLKSPGGGDGIHPSPLPCPFYRLTLNLIEEEYETCKNLPPQTVFSVGFKLKD